MRVILSPLSRKWAAGNVSVDVETIRADTGSSSFPSTQPNSPLLFLPGLHLPPPLSLPLKTLRSRPLYFHFFPMCARNRSLTLAPTKNRQ
jgi:hypothetical protein